MDVAEHTTQLEWVRKELLTKGYVSRNDALKRYITRLGALINRLKVEEGMKIEGAYQRNLFGRDFVYWLAEEKQDE